MTFMHKTVNNDGLMMAICYSVFCHTRKSTDDTKFHFIYKPFVFLFVCLRRRKTILYCSKSAVNSMRARDRTFSMSLGDKSSIRVIP